jgi:D-alanyl-D-alanine carboxypeptidase
MKKSLVSILLIAAVLLTACGSGNSQPAATPTTFPTPETVAPPTDAPTLVPTVARPAQPVIDAALLANDWHWIGLSDPTQQLAIEKPADYVLAFQGDGTVLIKADCNNATGTYQTDNGAISITVGPMTMAACPPGSRSDQFVTLIGNVARYSFKDGNLYIDLKADGGTLTFAPPDALGGDDSTAPGQESLQAQPWQWTSFTGAAEQFNVTDPGSYMVTFAIDGSVSIKADCNNAAGTYTTNDGALTITVGPMTLAACPPGSRSDQFVKLLSNAARYHFLNGGLYIDLKADGGTMAFAPVRGAAAPAKSNTASATGSLPADLTAQLDRWLQSLVSSDPKDPMMAAPGVILLVDTPQGRYLKAAGVSSLEQNTPMRPEDIMKIGSNTKSMTVALLMQLQEAGVLSLDDQLSKWLPEWAAKLPNGNNMTLRQIAQHTAGLWDYADQLMGSGLTDPAKLKQGYTPAEIMQYCVDQGKPVGEPGKQWSYSNCGYILLGMIAEKATGQKLGELYQQRIFDPLGMKSAALIDGIPQPGQVTSNGYYWQPDGTPLNTKDWNMSQGWAAGANVMTAADLATYGEGLAAGKLFKQADSLPQMLTFDAKALMSAGFPYGLGLFDVGDGYWGHEGATLGFQSLWFTNPDTGITVVGLSNSGSFEGYNFINVINILQQGGAQPVSAVGLLNLGPLPVDWEWVQTASPTGVTDVPAGTRLTLTKGGAAVVKNDLCPTYANGKFTVDADQHIGFKFDAPDASCTAPGDAAKLAELLTHAAFWRFKDGLLAVELAADGGTLLFKYKQ